LVKLSNCDRTIRKIEELRVRAAASAQTQEGTKPPDDANQLISEIERLFNETTALIQRINRTNVVMRLPDGSVLADALALRDAHLALRSALQGIAKAASEPQQRYMRSEIRVVRTVDTAAILKRADELSRKHRLLDASIQEVNTGVRFPTRTAYAPYREPGTVTYTEYYRDADLDR
jgi:hypothetical protein